MQKTAVMDFLAIVRCLGYALAVVMAVIALIVTILGSTILPFLSLLASIFLPGVAVGLIVAWTASLSRVFLRFSRFMAPQT